MEFNDFISVDNFRKIGFKEEGETILTRGDDKIFLDPKTKEVLSISLAPGKGLHDVAREILGIYGH